MAFTFYTGLQIAAGTTADWDSVAHPNEVKVPSVRTLCFVGSSGLTATPASIQARIQNMKNAGVQHVILCVAVVNNVWSNVTLATWTTAVTSLVQTVNAADAWEIGNEPSAAAGSAGTVGGLYWSRLKAAADLVKQYQQGKDRILAAPYSNGGIQAFYNNANTQFKNDGLDIRDYIDGWAIHLYKPTPADSLNVLSGCRTANNLFPNPPTGGGSWANLPVWITEFGWTVFDPNTPVSPQFCTPPVQATNLTTSFNNYIANREPKKIRGAYWYVWQDLESLKASADGYMGLKKSTFAESAASPPTGTPAPTPLSTSTNGYRAARAALDAVVANNGTNGVVDPPAAPTPPTATTVAPPDLITQTSAKLKGTVNPNGKATTVWIEYGQAAGSYGFSTPAVGYAAGAGTATLNIGMAVSGLTAGQTYHYRLKAQNSDGVAYGSDQSFQTAAPPLPPTVITGTATAIEATHVDLSGVFDPNEVASGGSSPLTIGPSTLVAPTTILGSLVGGGGAGGAHWWFEYGLTKVPAFSTPTVSAGGVDPLSVSATIPGLIPGVTYWYRLVGSNSVGTTYGNWLSVTTIAPDTPFLEGPTTLLALELSVEITTHDGQVFRWDVNAEDVRDRPVVTPFSTQQGDGFAEASVTLARPLGIDWPDLGLLRRVRYIGGDGSIAYEGRIAGQPVSISEDGEWVELNFAGLMSSAADQKFVEWYVARATDVWQPPSLALRKQLMADDDPLDSDYTVSVDTGSIHFRGSKTAGALAEQKWIPLGSQTIVVAHAPDSVRVASMQYRGSEKNVANVAPGKFFGAHTDNALLGDTSVWEAVPAAGMTLNGQLTNQRVPFVSGPYEYVGMRMNATANNKATVPAHRILDRVALYGAHSVPLRANGSDPDGVFASDVLADIVDRWCPQLDASQIEQTDFVIASLAFTEPTTPFDAFTLLNGYHHWLLAVWENGLVQFEPADLTTADWQVRSDEAGVDVNLTGDTIDAFCSGVIVAFTDVDGRNRVLWPDVYAVLRDDDPDNPANLEANPLWIQQDVSVAVDLNGALAIGAATLAEFNRPKSSGEITIRTGYLRDSAGHYQPGWRVRYGQTVSVVDLPNDVPRLITQTNWSGDGQTLTITVEQPSTRVDAALARIELQQQISAKLGG